MDDDLIIKRPEYEARNALYVMNLSKLDNRLDNVEKKIDLVDEKVNQLNASWWKFVAITCINFILGGGVVGLVEFLIKR